MDLTEKIYFGNPSAEHLQMINQLRPAGSPEYTAEELVVIPTIASSNMINGTYQVWSENALRTMVASYSVGNQDLTESHNGWNLDLVNGCIFDAELWRYNNPSPDLIEMMIGQSSEYEVERGIIAKQGLILVIAYAVVEADAEIVEDIRYLRKQDLSIGGWLHQNKQYCSVCSNPPTKMVQFDNSDCPHYMPSRGLMRFRDQLPLDEQILIAPYIIEDGNFDMIELSNVLAGSCSQARIINQKMLEMLVYE
jgi:hypothetical protein